MNTRPAEATSPRLTPWFGIAGLLVMATLLAAAFVQMRQHALLNLTVQAQDDYLVLSLYQLETDYLRLREQWHQDAGRDGADPAPLKLRYDIFASRAALLHTERAARLLRPNAAAAPALGQIDGFFAKGDLYLGDGARAELGAPAAQALLAQLQALDAPIHQLLLDASHQVAAQVSERQAAMRQHNQIALALTSFLSAMVLVFALLALRQMRKLAQRGRRLELLADQLRDARIEAENASTAKSRFLADMSHELRTPLHGLLGMVSLLKDSPRDPQAGHWLQTADDSARHLMHLLDDIVDLSRLEAGTLALQPQAVSLRGLIGETQALMQPQALAKGLRLQATLAEDLPSHVRLDPTRVRQVLYNLLNNAIKYSDSGTVTLGCHRSQGPAGAPQLAFVVTDTGVGMDQATVEQLFRGHHRTAGPLRQRHGGAGLGLAISHQLAGLMGGEILVRSTPGEGSVFTFRCPLEAQPGAAPATAPAPAAGVRALRVLVAEDHPVNRMFVAALLERLGHHAHCVADGREAVQALGEQPFDLVLMDVHMPVLDGVAATEQIRALPAAASRVRIAALTADAMPDTRDRCLRAGIDEVLTKPVSLEALTAALARGAEALPPAAGVVQVAGGPGAGTLSGPARETPLIDHAVLASVTGLMGAQRAPVLYSGFFEQADDAARRMREAMREADPQGLRRAAHAVKGAALNLGLPALAESCSLLAREAEALPPAQLALAVQRFEERVQATRALCQAQGLVA